ncbi:MAG TPA: hypothetical protein DDZ39_09750 [Flavobacteriaceae bacterium]|nr:hypothetical protein [Flavobacteriaceae bacterium]HBS12987.1 hypothetical protein [Flavobacteriaceae bacterium]
MAYNAKTDKIVWKFDAGLGISAPPITYKINGRQYISLLVGFGGGYARGGLDAYNFGWSYRTHTRRLITFSLDGNADMPALPPRHFPKPIVPEDFVINEKKAAEGMNEYWKCFICHGDNMFSGGMAPDLRASPIAMNKEAFAIVVKDGAKNAMGMPSFPDMTDEQLENLMHFIRKRAKETMPDYEKTVKDNAAKKEWVS